MASLRAGDRIFFSMTDPLVDLLAGRNTATGTDKVSARLSTKEKQHWSIEEIKTRPEMAKSDSERYYMIQNGNM
jgi:hypothetical protein